MRYLWLFELPDIIRYWGLPRGCWHCEVLGMCRRPKEEGWKCYHGCMVLNWENERKYEGLPRGCWNCKYLTECRRPKEEGWKCYNGYRVIKEKEAKTKYADYPDSQSGYRGVFCVRCLGFATTDRKA